MLSTRFTVPAFFVFLATGTALWAHPGHGAIESDSVAHYLIEPAHGWWLLLLGAVIGVSVVSRFFVTKNGEKVRVRK